MVQSEQHVIYKSMEGGGGGGGGVREAQDDKRKLTQNDCSEWK